MVRVALHAFPYAHSARSGDVDYVRSTYLRWRGRGVYGSNHDAVAAGRRRCTQDFAAVRININSWRHTRCAPAIRRYSSSCCERESLEDLPRFQARRDGKSFALRKR